MRALLIGLLLATATLATGCAGRAIAVVQTTHGHEFSCDRRYVRAEREPEHEEEGTNAQRWVSRGCGFEAEWTCERGECALQDSRAHGMGAP